MVTTTTTNNNNDDDKNSAAAAICICDNTQMEKSAQDDRSYKMIQLKENQLTILLISDPNTDKAAAAMDVRVGHLSDPEEAPGLAHFCEHMLFMGTTKYPDENEYNVYLSAHGGSSNAYTDMESTNYHFDVSPEHLEGALDRFAQFFIAPLFHPSSTERELQAVDSEHAKNLQSDVWRNLQLIKSLCRPDHPFSKFGSGNRQTLLPSSSSSSSLDHLRNLLLQFHKRYYSANVMKLVVLGQESLEELEKMCIQYTSDIPNDESISKPVFDDGEPFSSQELGKQLKVVPVRDGTTSLDLQFPMREIDSLYLYKPTRYLSHLIGHEGTGSILSVLKQKGWANELSSGESRSCSDWSAFTISIDLTDDGLDNVDRVVELVFAYIHLLSSKEEQQHGGIQEWIHEESATVAACQFRFLSKRDPMDYALFLASTMQVYPPHHVLAGPYLLYQYDADLIATFLDSYLQPQHMLMQITSKTFEGTTTCQEKWYGTEYTITDLTKEQMEQWSNATIDTIDSAATSSSTSTIETNLLALPERNDMIASDFTLLTEYYDVTPKDEPRLLELDDNDDDSFVRLWYKPDNVFDMPKVNIMVLIRTDTCSSAAQSVKALLYTQLLQEVTNDFTYLASMASLYSNVSHGSRGLELTVSGYNHKARILLKRLVQAMTSLSSSDPKDYSSSQSSSSLLLWERVKDKVSNEYDNFQFAQPYQHAMYACDVVSEPTTKWEITEKQQALSSSSISRDDVLEFGTIALSEYEMMEIFVHGNMSPTDAKDVANILRNGFPRATRSTSTTSSIPPKQLVRQFSSSSSSSDDDDDDDTTSNNTTTTTTTPMIHTFPEPNPNNTNSCLTVMYQMGPVVDLQTNAVLALLHHLLKEPAFHELRTQEQLGYIVHTQIKTSGTNVKSILCLIQSDVHDPKYLEERLDVFFTKTLPERLQNEMNHNNNDDNNDNDEWFRTHVQAVCQSLREKDKNLFEETMTYWTVILNQTYTFQRLMTIANHLEYDVTKEQVMELVHDLFLNSKKKLSVRVVASQHLEQMGMMNETTTETTTATTTTTKNYFPLPTIPNLDSYKL